MNAVAVLRWMAKRPVYGAVLMLVAIPHVGVALFCVGVAVCVVFRLKVRAFHDWCEVTHLRDLPSMLKRRNTNAG